jgi:hypothetical protein
VGLCHGIAGNAYGFLSLYRATKDARYLSCAQQYAAYMAGHWEELYDTPDRPASLFEVRTRAVIGWLLMRVVVLSAACLGPGWHDTRTPPFTHLQRWFICIRDPCFTATGETNVSSYIMNVRAAAVHGPWLTRGTAAALQGLAGAVCLWLDVLAPEQSRFPGYEL